MKTRHMVAAIVSVAAMALATNAAFGQNYPNRPIRFVAGGVGTGTDFTARLIGQEISVSVGQPVVVDNRPTGIPRGQIVAKALPDGYTILFTGSSFWLGPFMESTPYDPVRDFAPITTTDSSPGVLITTPSLPVKTVKELIALAKAKPGGLNYASGSTGSGPHLAAELFKAVAGVDMVRVPYKAFGVAMTDLMAGDVQVAFPGPGLVLPQVNSGKLRVLAVTTAQPSALFPGVPTVAASGLPGYEFSQLTGVFAPAKTPAAIINRLNQEMVRVLRRDDVKQKVFNTGSEVVADSPAQLAASVKSEMTRLGKVIKDAGIKAD